MSLVNQTGASLNSFRQIVTVRQAWVGLVILILVALLVLTATVYWQHVTGVNALHLLAFLPNPIIQGC